MNKTILFRLLLCTALLGIALITKAQVTIGSNISPNRATLLDLKSQQEAGTVISVGDNNNVTSSIGGLLLPRVQLESLTSLMPFLLNGDTSVTHEFKLRLAGLMVYNIFNNGASLYPGVYVWDGEIWGTSGVNKSAQPMTISSQPQSFSFYEKGDEIVDALVFSVNPPLDTEGVPLVVTYQWYEVTGSNVHAKTGLAISGAIAATYTPKDKKVIKGTTRSAANTGLYRFYCEASSNGSTLRSDIVEIAVGCGAKNNLGEWISFMCFNLGAHNESTIASQISYPIGSFTNTPTGVHTYIPDEEKLWGDLFQWGRVHDGHQFRQSEVVLGTNMTIAADLWDGTSYGTPPGIPWPYRQIDTASVTYGRKFIRGTSANGYNWRPVDATADLMWRNGRFAQNDPCARYKADGTYTGLTSNTNSGTGWRTPSISEWSEIYKGVIIAGTPGIATANTWYWNDTNGQGFEIRPDGTTTTLFLPAGGDRINTALGSQGATGYYWSTSIAGTNSSYLYLRGNNINPAAASNRDRGMAIRCVKDQ